jgi:hypothetical protein
MAHDWTPQIEAIAHIVSDPAQREVVKIEALKHLERVAESERVAALLDFATLLDAHRLKISPDHNEAATKALIWAATEARKRAANARETDA